MPGTIPKVTEVDDLMKKGVLIQESLSRIRDVILAQHAVMTEQVQDSRVKPAPAYNQDESASYQDDAKAVNGGFAGGDPKKRRGVRYQTVVPQYR